MWGITLDQLLFEACSVAETYKFDRVEPEHVLFALLTTERFHEQLRGCGMDLDEVIGSLEAGFRFQKKRHGVDMPRLIISDRVMRVLEISENQGVSLFRNLLPVIRERWHRSTPKGLFSDPLPDLDEILDAVEREQSDLAFDKICDDVFQKHTGGSHQGHEARAQEHDVQEEELKTEPRPERLTGSSTEKSSLSSKERMEAKRAVERSIRDLTGLFLRGELDPVIGRDREIDQICRILMRRRKSNVLLVGEPGVGKTALMEGVAARIATSHDPALSRRPVLQASLGALVAGARYRGDFEIRMELLVEHALERQAVLFFDEMQMLIGSGATAERGMDGANLLKPVLARDGMSLIGATTIEEAASIRSDPALMRRFEAVMVNEPDPELMREIMTGAAGPYLAHHDVKADGRVLERLIEFADRYLPDRRFPDKAFDLLDSACVQARMSGHKSLKVDNIRFAVRQLGGTLPDDASVPGPKTESPEKKLVSRLSERIGGHPDALIHLAATVCSGEPSRPVVAHLAGPAGVGRRTLARELARIIGGPFFELDAGGGPDRMRRTIQAGLRPGARTVFLVNMTEDLDVNSLDLLKGILSTGAFPSETGKSICMDGAIILLRDISERKRIGFTFGTYEDHFRSLPIESIEMQSFSGERLKDAVQFELKRLSQLWSDSGVSGPVPDVESIPYDMNGTIPTWSGVIRICNDAVKSGR